MKRLNFRRITRTTQTDMDIVRDVIFDYTHFLYAHNTSFSDFRVISDKDNTQIFYYETKIINWFPISPIIRFIAIKKLNPKENCFTQIYINIKNKKITYFKCYAEKENDFIKIVNDFSVPVNAITYFFRKLVVKIINLKMAVMWKEDEEMLELRDKHKETNSIQCFAPTFNLEKVKENNFSDIIEKNFDPEFLFDIQRKD